MNDKSHINDTISASEQRKREMERESQKGLNIAHTLAVAAGVLVCIVFLITSIVVSYAVSENTHRTVKTQAREINKQIVFNYEQYIQSIIQMANYMQYKSLNYDFIDNNQELRDLFVGSAESRSDVFSLVLVDGAGNTKLGSSQGHQNPKAIREALWFQAALANQEVYHFFSPTNTQQSFYWSPGFIISHSFRYSEGGVEKFGVLLVEMNHDKLELLKELTNLGPRGHILFLDDQDRLVYASVPTNEAYIKETFRRAVAEDFGSYSWTIDGRKVEVNINILPFTRWRIVTSYDVGPAGQLSGQIGILLGIILLGAVITAIIVGLAISKRISKPIDALRAGMDEIAAGSKRRHIEIHGQREIVSLANTFNSMMEENDRLTATLLEEQKQKRRTAMTALQNQINPHFLYNTLDSVVWLAEKHKSESVIKMVTALAKFFRIGISRGRSVIGVSEELAHVRHYLEIQEIRYLDRISYAFEVDPEVEKYHMIKLLLQPIVENAINHGLSDEPVHIIIRARLEHELLVFSVENSGYGITEDRICEIMQKVKDPSTKEGVGLKNIYQRITLLYGERADLSIESELDEYTRVILRIPCRVEADA